MIEICGRWEQHCHKGGRWRPKKYERPSKSCCRLKLKNYKQNQTINSTSLTYISIPSVDYGALEVVIFLNSSLKSWEKDHHEYTVLSLDDSESIRKGSAFFLPRFTLPRGKSLISTVVIWYTVCDKYQFVTDIYQFSPQTNELLQLPIPESLWCTGMYLKNAEGLHIYNPMISEWYLNFLSQLCVGLTVCCMCSSLFSHLDASEFPHSRVAISLCRNRTVFLQIQNNLWQATWCMV